MAKTARRTRGDGALYFDEAKGLWRASVDLGIAPNGKRRRKVVSSKTQAGALAKLREVRRAVETHGTVPTSGITVEAWLKRWLHEVARPRVKPRTLDGYAHKVGLIDEAVGRVRLDKLTASHVRQVHRHAMADGRSSTTALHCHRVLRKALEDARREGLVLTNVADLVDAPSAEAFDAGSLTGAQAKALLRSLDGDPLAARWLVALLYGVRQGEALGLTWSSVDLVGGTIDLDWQLQRLTWRHGCEGACGRKRGADCPSRDLGIPAGVEHRVLEGAYVLTRPKRGKRRRVPLLPLVDAALRLRAKQSTGLPNPHGLVFARPDGRPFDPSRDSVAWHEHLAAAALPDLRLHDARHTAATLLLELGVDAKVISSILGHSNVVTTRGYQQVSLDLQRQALGSLVGELT